MADSADQSGAGYQPDFTRTMIRNQFASFETI